MAYFCAYINAGMDIEFDPAKNASNIVKHGISLARARRSRSPRIRRMTAPLRAKCATGCYGPDRRRRLLPRRDQPQRAGACDKPAAARTQGRRAAMSDKTVLFDEDNPEWTDADFAAARPGSALPPEMLAAFPRTQGRPPGRLGQGADHDPDRQGDARSLRAPPGRAGRRGSTKHYDGPSPDTADQCPAASTGSTPLSASCSLIMPISRSSPA